MIKAEIVPEAVWRVAMMTYHREIRRNPEQAWQLAIAAAITTWPGAEWLYVSEPVFALPMPTENNNAEA